MLAREHDFRVLFRTDLEEVEVFAAIWEDGDELAGGGEAGAAVGSESRVRGREGQGTEDGGVCLHGLVASNPREVHVFLPALGMCGQPASQRLVLSALTARKSRPGLWAISQHLAMLGAQLALPGDISAARPSLLLFVQKGGVHIPSSGDEAATRGCGSASRPPCEPLFSFRDYHRICLIYRHQYYTKCSNSFRSNRSISIYNVANR